MLKDCKIACFLAFKLAIRGSYLVLILTPIGIGLSVVNLVFSSSMFAGVTHSIDKQLVENLFSSVLVEPKTDKDFIFNATTLIQRLESIPEVEAASAHYKLQAQFVFDPDKDNRNVQVHNYQILGINPEKEPKVTQVATHLKTGEYLSTLDRDGILLGMEIAGGREAMFNKLSLKGVKVGDKVKVEYSNHKIREYTVKGIFRTGVDFIDSLAFITDKEAEGILSVNDAASEVLVRAKDPMREDLAPLIASRLEPGLQVNSWPMFSGLTGTMSNSFGVLNVVIGLVNLVVAGTVIFIVIFIHIVNKRRQLGILRAIGIRARIIVLIYVIQALAFLMLGVATGLAVSYFVLSPYFISHPLNMGFGMVSMLNRPQVIVEKIFLVSIASLFAGFWPAWRITKQNIVRNIWGV